MSHFDSILTNINTLICGITITVAIGFNKNNITIAIIIVVDHIQSSNIIAIISCIFNLYIQLIIESR